MITVAVSEFKIISTPNISCLPSEQYVQDIEIPELGIRSYTGYLKGDFPHSRGKAIYEDKSVYIGEFSNGERDGHGIYTEYNFKNIWHYKGLWKNGNLTFGNKEVIHNCCDQPFVAFFSGKFRDNGAFYSGHYFSQYDSQETPENKSISGSDATKAIEAQKNADLHAIKAFKVCSKIEKAQEGSREVENVEIISLHIESYTGELYNGVPDGNGKAVYTDRSVYTGKFKDGLRTGEAKIYFPNGQLRYEGSYEKNEEVGHWKFYNEQGKLVKEKDY